MWINESCILATADGSNFLPISKWDKSSELLCYCGKFNDKTKKYDVSISPIRVLDSKVFDSFLVTLSNGDSIILNTENVSELPSFFTYTNPNGGTRTRNIYSFVENTDEKETRQRDLIYEYHTGEKGYIIFKDFKDTNLDSFDNLKLVSESEYSEFIRRTARAVNNGFGNFNQLAKNEYGVGISHGKNNGKYTGMSNEDLVKVCKEYHKRHPKITNIRRILKDLLRQGHPIPQTFSKYRFGGNKLGYSTLKDIVMYDLPYKEIEVFIDSEKIRMLNSEEKNERLDFIQDNYFEYLPNSKPRRKNLKVMSIKKIESSRFYLLNNTVAILTSSCDSNYNNSNGVFL